VGGSVMKANSKEFYELMGEFEKIAKQYFYGRLEHEKERIKGRWYEDGNINQLFMSFMLGYQHAKCKARIGDLNCEE
jgi:hypothetical protein